MSAVAAAIGVGAAATIAGSIASSKAQSKAAKQNRQSQAETNQLNYDMFRESRGSEGSAVMPLYMESAGGGLFESQLGREFVDMWDSTAPDRGRFDALDSEYQPMFYDARRTAAGIFDGGVERKMISNFEPVAKARTTFRRQSAIDSLNKTLSEIDAIQAGRGFSGDGLGKRMLKYKANADAADAIASANLQNLEEERAIRDAALKLRLGSLDVPFTMAGRDIEAASLGNNAYLDAFSKRLVPMNFLRVGTSAPFQYQPLTYTATPGTGQLVAQGIGQLAGTGVNYALQKQQNDAWMNYLNGMKPGGAIGSQSPQVAPTWISATNPINEWE